LDSLEADGQPTSFYFYVRQEAVLARRFGVRMAADLGFSLARHRLIPMVGGVLLLRAKPALSK
jgi:hypothetical protein